MTDTHHAVFLQYAFLVSILHVFTDWYQPRKFSEASMFVLTVGWKVQKLDFDFVIRSRVY